MRLYKTEPQPVWGHAYDAAPGVHRIVAPNPSPGRLHGSNTYLVEVADGCACIDPGPLLDEHRKAILAAAGGRLSIILLTHSHPDHAEGAAALAAAAGVPVAGYFPPALDFGLPDIAVSDGMTIAGLRAVHTPGHASDHLCYARGNILFSGDLVMSWANTIIRPPDGNLTDYLNSLERLLRRSEGLYLPGHGPAVDNPHEHMKVLRAHRLSREAMIADAVRDGLGTVGELADRFYASMPPQRRGAAEAIILAHLNRLRDNGLLYEAAGHWRWLGKTSGD